jgi:hypothetical protein
MQLIRLLLGTSKLPPPFGCFEVLLFNKKVSTEKKRLLNFNIKIMFKGLDGIFKFQNLRSQRKVKNHVVFYKEH